MGSTPSQKIEIDLNGTGTLVDVTAYVDQGAGIEHAWGKTDWTADVPTPGTLTFTLENLDGRFTPGNEATYSPGCIVGTLVQWTCNTPAGTARVRRFRMATPSLHFPTGVAGKSLVTVQCFDALQLLANKTMLAMVDEAVAVRSPVAYWPLGEPSAAVITDTVCTDASGNHEASLIPWGDVRVGTMGFAAGVGPPTDDRAALVFLPGYTGSWPPDNSGLATTVGLSGSWDWRNQGSDGNTYNVVGVSMWVNISNVFGAASFGAAANTGPLVHLVTVGSVEIYWDAPHRGFTVHDAVAGTATSLASVTLGAGTPLSPGVTYQLIFVISSAATGTIANNLSAWLNGTLVGSMSLGTAGRCVMPGRVAIGGKGATAAATIGSTDVESMNGTVACLAIHRPPSVALNAGIRTMYDGGVGSAFLPADMYQAGIGTVETAAIRFTRLGRLLGNRNVAYAAQGTAQPFSLAVQQTQGKTLLDQMCVALRAEDAGLDVAVVGGIETVRAWLFSAQRSPTPALEVDVEADADGYPELTYDSSGVAVAVEVKNDSTAAVVNWLDSLADSRWRGTSTSITCALRDAVDMLALGQYRALLGRITTVTPSSVTVDGVTSDANLTAAMLALRPGVTVLVSGLPVDVVGYESTRCYLAGVKEHHSIGRSAFELTLWPTANYAATIVDPELGTEGAWRLDDFVTYDSGDYPPAHSICGNAQSVLTAAATTVYLYTDVADSSTPFLSTTAADYPLDIMVEDEIMTLPNPATAASWTGTGVTWWQTLTGVLRGRRGTTAATHAYHSGPITLENLASVSGGHESPSVSF